MDLFNPQKENGMHIEGARIYSEGVELNQNCEIKIRQMVKEIKSISPSADVGLRFIRTGRTVEALLWGKVSDLSLGVYNCGPSVSHVLGTIHRKLKKQYLSPSKIGSRTTDVSRTYKTFEQPAPSLAA